jgi:hypothetical protein
MTEELYTSDSSGCFPKVVNSWQQLLTTLNIKHPVYPLDPIAPEHSEFFLIDSKIRIRVIHISPESVQKTTGHYGLELHQNFKRSSLSEEYWFTKWNKPLKIGNCNCSFRRSLRLSVLSNQSNRLKPDDNRER